MKWYFPAGLMACSSAVMRRADRSERPTKQTRGWTACRANCFMVASPMPLVPPTKTATSPGGRHSGMSAFDARICSSDTILANWRLCRSGAFAALRSHDSRANTEDKADDQA